MTKQIFRPTLEEFVSLLKHRTLVVPDPPPGLPVEQAAPPAEVKPEENVKEEVKEEGKAVDGSEAKKEDGNTEEGSYIKKQHMMDRAKVSDEATLNDLKDVHMGCCVAMLRQEDAEKLGFIFNGKPLAISCWRGKITINLLTNKNETDQIREKFSL